MTSLNVREGESVTLRYVLILILITLFGTALRLYMLEAPALSGREMNTLRDAGRFTEMRVTQRAFGFVPTALALRISGAELDTREEIAIHEWKSAGVTHANARIATALIGGLSILFIGLSSPRMMGRGPSIITALLFAVSVWHIEWSQEARYYTQQLLFYTLAFIWYYIATRDRSHVYFFGALLWVGLAFLSQPPAIVIGGVFAADWLIGLIRREPVRIRALWWILGLAAVGSAAGILIVGIMQRPETWEPFVAFEGGTRMSPITLIELTLYAVGPLVVIMAGCRCLAMLRNPDRLTIYLALGAGVPLVCFAVWAIGNQSLPRYCFIVLWPWLALCGIALYLLYEYAKPEAGRVLACSPLLLVMASSGIAVYTYFGPGYQHRPRWTEAIEYLSQHWNEGDAVFSQGSTLDFYFEKDFDDVHPLDDVISRIEACEGPVWIVIPEFGGFDPLHHWAQTNGEMRLVLQSRTPRPFHSLTVYRYDSTETENDM